jgi:hypothetical protein
LTHFDQVAIGVAHAAADLAATIGRRSQKFRFVCAPPLINGRDVGNTDVQETQGMSGIGYQKCLFVPHRCRRNDITNAAAELCALLEATSVRDYSVFPTVGPAKMAYLAERASGCVRCPVSSWEEEIYTMVGGLAVFAVFCVAAWLWLG